jgi:SAM-dependent methyltransferase
MTNSNNYITTREFWNSRADTAALVADGSPIFADIFCKYLSTSNQSGKRALEIGAYPGRFLYHLAVNHGYSPYAVDYCAPAKNLPAMFETMGAPQLTLFHEDFLEWDTDEQFDLVCSFGFIEHFNDWRGLIQRHAKLVARGGYLILATPYFRKMQYILHRLLDTPNLRQHNIEAMDDRAWRRILVSSGFEVVRCDPYRTCQFWLHVDEVGPIRSLVGRAVSRITEEVDARIDRPNRFMSPYLVCVAQRPSY